MNESFNNIKELEAQVKSLPEAEMRALHTGKTLNKTGSPKQLKQDLSEMDEENTTAFNGSIDRSAETDAVAIVNKETESLATVGTPHYDIVNHEDAFQPVIESLKDLGVSVSGQIRKKDGGNRVLLQAQTDREFTVDGEKYGIGFQVKNTYNKSGSVVLRGFFVRQICSNGMIGREAMGIAPLKRQHRGEVDILDDYKEWMQELFKKSERLQEILVQAMEDMFQEEELVTVLINAGIPKTRVDEILDLVEPADEQPVEIPEEHVSRKQLYDAVTNYATHEMEDVAFSTEERYQKYASNVLTEDEQDLTQVLPDEELPESQETLENPEQTAEAQA